MPHGGGWRLFVFDFDGVLVDSYSCLPMVYEHVGGEIGLRAGELKAFVKRMIDAEDREELVRNYDRSAWWPMVLEEFGVRLGGDRLDGLVREYWRMRGQLSERADGAVELLRWLKGRGALLAILCGSDGLRSMKRERIDASGLGGFFDDILIIGEDVASRVDGLRSLMARHGTSRDETVLIDDKPEAVNDADGIGVATVMVTFTGPLRSAWSRECSPQHRVGSVKEIRGLVPEG